MDGGRRITRISWETLRRAEFQILLSSARSRWGGINVRKRRHRDWRKCRHQSRPRICHPQVDPETSQHRSGQTLGTSRRARSFSHELPVHPVKGMYALLLLHAEPPARIASCPQILLHRFADPRIFKLNLVAELHRCLRRESFVILLQQILFKDRQRPLGVNGRTIFNETLSG